MEQRLLTIRAIMVAILAAGAAVFLFVQLRSFTDADTQAKVEFFRGDLGDRLFKKVTTDAEFRTKIEKAHRSEAGQALGRAASVAGPASARRPAARLFAGGHAAV